MNARKAGSSTAIVENPHAGLKSVRTQSGDTPVDESLFSACACVIVTHNPELSTFDRQIKALLPQVGNIIIADNNSGPQCSDYLAELARQTSAITVIFLKENAGIARAQNLGAAAVERLGKRYVLFLDHDSIPGPDLVSGLYEAAEGLRKKGVRLGAVGARLVDPRSGRENGFYSMRGWRWRRVYCASRRKGLLNCDYLNSSGSFVPVDVWKDVGPFDERFFIDHVDTDWFMRAKAKGYKCYGLCSGGLEHYMGDDVIRYWLFGWRYMPRRSPLRHYYIVRNSLWLYRRAYVPLAWKVNNAVKLLFTLVYFPLFDVERGRQFKMILRGLWDGIRGRARDLPS